MKIQHKLLCIAATLMLLASQAQAVLFWARPYDPNLGRWLQRDPIGEGGGINLYEYVANNPINWIDPDGTTLLYSGHPFPGQSPTDYGPYTLNIDDGSDKIMALNQLTQSELGYLVSSANLKVHCSKHATAAEDRENEKNFDTPIFRGKNPDMREYYEYDGHIYGDNEINYLGIGIYEVWMGDDQAAADGLTISWKASQYYQFPSSGTFYWLHYGMNHYVK